MKQMPLSKGQYAIVDDDDFETLSKWKWHVNTHGYAIRTVRVGKKKKHIRMHRFLLQGDEIDHIDRNRLNNCKANLRICNRTQNNANSKSKGGSSRYKGVHLFKRTGKWQAYINKNYKRKCLGYFDCEFDAAKCYDVHAVSYFGVFAKTNFPSVL